MVVSASEACRAGPRGDGCYFRARLDTFGIKCSPFVRHGVTILSPAFTAEFQTRQTVLKIEIAS